MPLRPHPFLPVIFSLAIHFLAATRCSAYIPAVPVNDTSGLNFTDSSTILISWTDPAGVYSGAVSYQLMADVATGGTTSGALVHFSESDMGENFTTSTPWIAYISCDVNETNASQEWDIFTLARDRGAVSALLYTAQSQSCLLNPEYIFDFEKPLDVFATKTVQVARVIDNQFTHTNASFYDYNGTLLDDSGTAVNNSLDNNAPSTKTYLIGTLSARNSTGQATATSIPGATTSAVSDGSSSKKTSAPMIVLYTITGIVSSMFILMLLIGARRAMMHPERYGRREGDDTQGPQSTAGGLAQAILDTFPVVKFNRHNDHFNGRSPKRLPSENNLQAYTMPDIRERESMQGHPYSRASLQHDQDRESRRSYDRMFGENAVASGSGSSSKASASDHRRSDAMPQMREVEEGETSQCPICLVEFEEGDDLRVLPCEREHMYHRGCIDPWLLKVSGSCPLCRKDFNNPQPPSAQAQTPAQSSPLPTRNPSETAVGASTSTDPGGATDPPTHHGFARYLAFMRREKRPRTRSGASRNTDSSVGAGRRREADQTGPGGY